MNFTFTLISCTLILLGTLIAFIKSLMTIKDLIMTEKATSKSDTNYKFIAVLGSFLIVFMGIFFASLVAISYIN